MMPGVGLDGGALNVASDAIDITEQNFFYHDNDNENAKREWGRTVMRRANFPNTFNRQTERGGKNAKCNNDGCDRFGFSVAVRMRFVGRTCRELQAAPNN